RLESVLVTIFPQSMHDSDCIHAKLDVLAIHMKRDISPTQQLHRHLKLELFELGAWKYAVRKIKNEEARKLDLQQWKERITPITPKIVLVLLPGESKLAMESWQAEESTTVDYVFT